MPKTKPDRSKWKGKHSYDDNKAFVRMLMDNNFLPYTDAEPEWFIDVADENHQIFTPNYLK